MDEPTTDVIQGTLDMLVLKTLSLEPMRGFGIARRIEQMPRAPSKSIRARSSRRCSVASAADGWMRTGVKPKPRGVRKSTNSLDRERNSSKTRRRIGRAGRGPSRGY